MIPEYAIAGALFVIGLVSAVRSLLQPPAEERGGDRLLIALHDVAKAMFWLSLGGFFLVYGVSGRSADVRWLVLVPLGMAALRMVAAAFVSRA